MVNSGTGLRWSQLVAIALVVGLVSFVGWRVYLGRGHLLSAPSWVSAVLLVIMAVLVLAAGLPVRRFLRGRATKTLSPIRAARTLVLAQAAGLTGSAVLGWYAGLVPHAVADLDLPGYRDALWRLLTVCVAAALLAVAGMLTQRMCRIDDGDEGRRREGRSDD